MLNMSYLLILKQILVFVVKGVICQISELTFFQMSKNVYTENLKVLYTRDEYNNTRVLL